MNADDPAGPPGGPVHIVLDELVEDELIVGHEDFEGEMAELFGTKRVVLRIELHDAAEGHTRLVLTQGPTRRTSRRTPRTAGAVRQARPTARPLSRQTRQSRLGW